MPRVYDYKPDADLASLLSVLWARVNTRAFTGGTLAAKATGDPDLKTTTTINYALNGKLIIQAAAATIDVSGLAGCVAGVAAGTWNQGIAKYAAYLLTLASGTWNLLKGVDAATAAAALMLLPACPANVCPVGMVVVTNTTNAFTFGTTNSDAPGVTFTCSDLSDIVNGLGSIYADVITQ